MTPLLILILLLAPATAMAQGIECRVIQSDVLIQPNETVTTSVSCPAGLVLTGGGAQCGIFPLVTGLNTAAMMYPEGDPASWTCQWRNWQNERASCLCDAICCTMSAGPEPLPLVCSHDECLVGDALEVGCDACVDTVCACDSYCCETNWDTFCVHEAQQLCGKTCNSTNSCLAACGCP